MTDEQIIEAAIQGHASTRDAIRWAINQVRKQREEKFCETHCSWTDHHVECDQVHGDAEPVAFEFQHEDTGLIDFVDPQQVEWGFQKNNPRWQLIGPVFRHPAPAVVQQPLTEEQIGLLTTDPKWAHVEAPLLLGFARSIERAHGIGGSND